MATFVRFAVLVLLSIVLPALSGAQINWTRHPSNPVFTISGNNSNEIHSLSYAMGPSVLWDQSRGAYFAWFESVPEGGVRFSISQALSLDGSTWYYHSRSPVLETGPAAFDYYNVRGPCVIKDAGGYKMYYTAASASSYSIGMATSADGIHWQKNAGNPILTSGAPGSWDDSGLLYCKVLLIGQTYYMWYSGRDGSTSRIGLATSPDGITWAKHPANPVLNEGGLGQWDAYYVEDPVVVHLNGIFYMLYTARPQLSSQQLGLATSVDGVVWQKYVSNPVLTGQPGWEGSNVTVASMLWKDNAFHLWYSANGSGAWQAGYATSNLEYPPNPQPNIILNPGFEAGTASWSFFTNGAGSFASVAPGSQSTKAARVSITTPGTNVQLYQTGFRLEPNTQYRLSFDAYSNTGHDVSVHLLKNTSPYTNYGVNGFVANLTAGWQQYALVFTTTGFAASTTDTRLRFWFAPYDAAGDQFFIDNVSITRLAAEDPGNLTSATEMPLPTEATLGQNYPNPFNPTTTISYALPEESRVRIEVFNTLGELVADLFDGTVAGGYHSVPFDAENLSSGTYFYRLTATPISGSPKVLNGKMVLLK